MRAFQKNAERLAILTAQFVNRGRRYDGIATIWTIQEDFECDSELRESRILRHVVDLISRFIVCEGLQPSNGLWM